MTLESLKSAAILLAALDMLISTPAAESDVIEPLRESVARAISEFDQIDAERKAELKRGADFIREQLAKRNSAELIFICTHNSRRSHFSQVWAQTAALYYGGRNLLTFSGGTEATACNPRTVQALRRAGFSVVQSTEGENPVYLAQISETGKPLRLYSKVFGAKENPQKDFVAVLTCGDAAESCPVVNGAALRLPLLFKDPKAADNTPQEKATYDERCRQIAREMFYMMSQVGGSGFAS
ncbi:MAG TPA: protein-tyrosine-phosphatase [Verrucomicrobiae bacterium]|nr:protein-tyrosine-phosphatase [Verrucomicrobiae bacterium]